MPLTTQNKSDGQFRVFWDMTKIPKNALQKYRVLHQAKQSELDHKKEIKSALTESFRSDPTFTVCVGFEESSMISLSCSVYGTMYRVVPLPHCDCYTEDLLIAPFIEVT